MPRRFPAGKPVLYAPLLILAGCCGGLFGFVGPPAALAGPQSGIAPAPEVSTDVYFRTEGPVSGPPAPWLTSEDYPSLPLPYPLSESRVVVWVLAQQHTYFGAFVLGVLLLVTLAEVGSMFCRDDERASRYRVAGRELLRLVVAAMAVAAVLGAVLLAGLVALYPGLTRYVAAVFRQSVLFYGVLIVTFSVTTTLYYYTWRTSGATPGRWDHFGLGVFANLLGTGLMVVANSWGTFMMSPAGVDAQGRFLGSDWDVFRNALSSPLAVHRFVGNLVFGGAVIATYAAYHAMTAATQERKAYYDWMGGMALLAIVGGFLTTPFGGYWLSWGIYVYRQQMAITLVGGLIGWLGKILVILIGMLVIAMTYYLWQRIDAEEGGRRFRHYAKYILMILVLGLLVYVTPHMLVMRAAELKAVGGQQHPVVGNYGVESAKQGAINLMLVAMIWSLLAWWRSKYREPNSRLPAILFALFIAGALNILWLSVTGYFIPANVRVGYQLPFVMTTFSLLVIGSGLTYALTRHSTPISSPAWGKLSTRGYGALLFIGVTVTWVMGLNGYRRSAVRLFWHVMEVVRDNSPWAFTHAIGFAGNVITFNALLFWLGMLGLVWLAKEKSPA